MRTVPMCLALTLSLVSAAPPVLAQEVTSAPGNPVIRVADATLTCVQIADEAASLSERMGGAPRGGLLSSIGGVAKAGAAMLIPGAGLAIAGADAVTQGGRDEAAAARTADENRWYYLNGLAVGRECQGGQTAPASVGVRPATPQ